MKAAIAIDKWKLKIFEHHLKQDGYEWVEGPGVTADTLILSVETERVHDLGATVKRANDECAEIKR